MSNPPPSGRKTYSLAAVWLAGVASGTFGLVIGACFGAYLMYLAYVGLSGPVRDNIAAGVVIEQARAPVLHDAEEQEAGPPAPSSQPE